MLKYYRISDPSDVRDLHEQMQQWVASNNPKAQEWAEQPLSPDSAAQWINGQWIVPPAPTFTAEEIVSQHFSPYEIAALQRFELTLMQAGKPLGQKMTAVKSWLESIMLAWSQNPNPLPAVYFGTPPFSFNEASAEAVASLTSDQ
jgi:hypothetical protein